MYNEQTVHIVNNDSLGLTVNACVYENNMQLPHHVGNLFFKGSDNHKGLLNCTSINAVINNADVTVLLDSGADFCLIGLNILNIISPEWGEYKDVINGPSSAIVANGQNIKFVGCKYFDVKIGNNIQQIAFAIPEFCEQILLGVDALIAFQIQLTFETDKVLVRAGNEIIKGLGEPVIYHIKIRVKLCYTPTSLNCTQ